MLFRHNWGMVVLFFCLTANVVIADQYHYQDILVGERASGLGGAYSAISDDPGGAFYNPAGLAFADKSYISISMNTIKNNQTDIKGVFKGGRNWQIYSSSFVPSFFGVMQDFDRYKVAFSMINPKSEVLNQDNRTNLITTVTSDPTEHLRNYNEKNMQYLMGPSIATMLTDSFSIGASCFLSLTDKEFIDNQYISYTDAVDKWGNHPWIWQNRYSEESSWGIMGILGAQYMPTKEISLSLVVKDGWDFSASAKQQFTNAVSANSSPSPNMPVLTNYTTDLLPLGYHQTPLSITTGFAYLFSPSLLFTSDLSWFASHSATSYYFDNKSIINLAAGIEYYISTNLPLRFGVYTNNANHTYLYPDMENVDLIGTTFGASWETEFSTLNLSLDYSFGSGVHYLSDSQGVLRSFDTDLQNMAISFSGSYMM